MAQHDMDTTDKLSETEPRHKLEKVVAGTASRKKESEFHKIASAFVQEDMDSVKKYVWADVIVPKLKELFESALTDGLSMMLWGSGRSRKKSSSNIQRVSYDQFGRDDFDDRRRSRRERNIDSDTPEYENLVFESREDAALVLETLEILLEEYNVVSILDLCDIAGIDEGLKNTYGKYGWKSMKNAKIVRDRDGWYLKLPRPRPL